MVHFMGSPQAFCIPIIRIPENFKPLVDKYVVNKKVGKAIGENSQTQGKSSPKIVIPPAQKTANAHKRIKNKKKVIAFPPATMIFLVMVPMKTPQQAMHNIFMRKPRHKFHNAESGEKNQYP